MKDTHRSETEAIRSDIDVTRRRMDDTMEALGERLQPRHLLDEFLGFFRRSTSGGDGKLSQVKDKVTHSADTALHAVMDAIKNNPMPALLIGAGLGWMVYENRKRQAEDSDWSYEGYQGAASSAGMSYDPDVHYDRPLQYSAGTAGSEWSEQGSKMGQAKEKFREKTGEMKDKLSHAGEAARERAGQMKQRAGEKLHAARERAGELGHRVGERTRDAYVRTRERVAHTADERPLELGLVCLAVGVIAGLALPTPRTVNRVAGPRLDELRERTREAGREVLEKGKRVAQAAVEAGKHEAESQGLTPGQMAEQAGQFAGAQSQRAAEAPPASNPAGSQTNDPTVARPMP